MHRDDRSYQHQALLDRDEALELKRAEQQASQQPGTIPLAYYLRPSLRDKKLNQALDGLSIDSDIDDRLSAAIKAGGRSIPRYLFRMWHQHSGGMEELNTLEGITPRAFTEGHHPSSVDEVEPYLLVKSVGGHIKRTHLPTFYSSWFDGLISMLYVKDIRDQFPDTHIAVVDTTKLSSANYVCWIGAREVRKLFPAANSGEYRIFGVVKGAAYKAVPVSVFDDLQNLQLTTNAFYTELQSNRTRGIVPAVTEQQVDDAIEVGKAFGGGFALLMAIHALSAYTNVSEQEAALDKLLQAFALQPGMADGLNVRKGLPDFCEAKNAARALQALVFLQASWDGVADDDAQASQGEADDPMEE